MEKDNRYTFDGRIRFSEVDRSKRLTLPGIINYFQDCSTFQSESLGLGVDYAKEHRRGWVLSAWQIVIERYPSLGEWIRTSTWATQFQGLLGLRNFCIQDGQGKMAAYANSVWAYMDMNKGRPTRPKKEETELYGTGRPLSMAYDSRKISFPEKAESLEAFPVRKCQIDTNEHVNNCQYVQMALEVLPREMEVHNLRVEYKKSALYGDVIYPKLACEDDRIAVALCDGTGRHYAVIELR